MVETILIDFCCKIKGHIYLVNQGWVVHQTGTDSSKIPTPFVGFRTRILASSQWPSFLSRWENFPSEVPNYKRPEFLETFSKNGMLPKWICWSFRENLQPFASFFGKTGHLKDSWSVLGSQLLLSTPVPWSHRCHFSGYIKTPPKQPISSTDVCFFAARPRSWLLEEVEVAASHQQCWIALQIQWTRH